MRIGIIDADLLDGGTTVPNLVCIKLSGYYKDCGHDVKLLTDYNSLDFDKIFIAKVFSKTIVPDGIIDLPHVAYGGTGFFYDKAPNLPDYIEHHHPDYSLYDDYIKGQIASGVKPTKFKNYTDFSIGYTTRGCFRKCDFCVNKKYDRVYRHSPVSEFLDESRKYIMLLDDNVLAFPHWRDVFEELQSTGKRFQFKQGMDIRLMTEEKARVIASSKYHDTFIFAFDDYKEKDIIIPRLRMFTQYTSKSPKLYLFCGFKSQNEKDIAEVFERLFLLWETNSIGYLMRFEKVYGSRWENIYTELAAWINQPNFQKKMSFREFVLADSKRTKTRKSKKLAVFEDFCKTYPDVAKKYFDRKLGD